MGALIALLAIAGAAVALGGSGSTDRARRTPLDGDAGGGARRPRRRRRPGRSPDSGPSDEEVPLWSRDADAIEDRAAQIWDERESKAPTVGARFVTTRDALQSLWPDLPWPHTLADQEPVDVPGTTGVFEQGWVVAAGPQGNALKIVWDNTSQFVNDLAYGGMPD